MVRTSVADPDPGSGAFLIPGSRMGKKSGSGIQIRDEKPESCFLELWEKFGSGSGMEKKSDPG